MATSPLLDAPTPLVLRLKEAGVADAKLRVVTDEPPPVRRRSPSATPTPMPAVRDEAGAPPVRRRSAEPAAEAASYGLAAAVAQAIADEQHHAAPASPPAAGEDIGAREDLTMDDRAFDWDATLDEENDMSHDPVTHDVPRRWSPPDDLPGVVLIVPILMGIAVISTVIGMIAMFS